MPAPKTPSPVEQALDSIVLKQLKSNPGGLTQTQLINKFRSNLAYGPQSTFHPNAIKKAVARLAIADRLSVSTEGNDIRITLNTTPENGKEAVDA